jgi:methionyl-tRNA formyltransferase
MKILFFGGQGCPFSKEAQNHLKTKGHEIQCEWASKRGQKVSTSALEWEGDLIVSFLNYIILPKELLQKAPAINFHPGPPEHPGSGCMSWGLYEGQKIYGVTVHEVNEEVDAGKILKVRRFDISDYKSREDLEHRAKTELLTLFYEYTEHTEWPREARKIHELDEMIEIDSDEKYTEVINRIRSFHTDKHPVHMYIGDKRFEYVPESD